MNKPDPHLRAYAHAADYANRVDVALVLDGPGRPRLLALPPVFDEIGDAAIQQPTFTLSRGAAQALAEQLAEAGFKSLETSRELTQLRATVADLRKLIAAMESLAK